VLTDPVFYLVSIPAVLLYGIAKGGFGGAVAILAVPLMALVMAPTQAAAILLPILVVMDFVVIYSYRGHFDRQALRLLLPGALAGILGGYLLAGAMNDDLMRLLVGAVALAFGMQALLGWLSHVGRRHNRSAATFFGALAGFTSFSIHAGGPPLTMYLLPKQLPPMVYAGTAGLFFWVVNLVKLPPYFALGQFTTDNLLYSLALVPLAPVGVLIGRRLVRLSNPRIYYRIIAAFLVLVGIKLLHDGYAGLSSPTSGVATPALTAKGSAVYTAVSLHAGRQESVPTMDQALRHVKLTETVAASPQIQAHDMAAIADAGFKVVINNRPDDEALDQPPSDELRAAAEAAGLEYHYYPLNAFNYPGDDADAMGALFDDASRPVFAFCRSGTRSTNLWISSRPEGERDAARQHAQQLGFDVSMSQG
jgi:uncharacterized protein (TIGR01244 family)